MIYRELGNSGLKVSVIGFGCWPVGNDWSGTSDQDSIATIKEAIGLGINFFDVAPVYGFGHAEKVLGKAVKGYRDRIYIASKCGLRWNSSRKIRYDLSRESILEEIDASLERLDTDYIDLYQIHWPDPNVSIGETMETLLSLKEKGKIRCIGVSNFSVPLLEAAMKYDDIVSNQVLYNMIDRNSDNYHGIPLSYRTEDEILPYCEKNNISVIPYSPLLQGLLTDDFQVDNLAENDVRLANPQLKGEKLKRNLRIVNELKEIAKKKYNRPLVQLALNWLISKKAITSIIAAPIEEEQVRENIRALEWIIDNHDMERIDKILNLY